MLNICFLFPGAGNHPCGGLKIICEYADRLARDGFQVHIAYAGSIYWKKKSLYFKLTAIVRYLQRRISGFSCRKWFPLDPRVKEHFSFSLNYCHVPKADIYIASNPYTAEYLNHYPVAAEKKFYFIQGYENWGDVSDDRLRKTYHFPLRKIVISHWLEKIMCAEGEKCAVVPNGFDCDVFKMAVPVAEKERYTVIMLNHQMARKGCQTGFAALALVKRKFPQLKVKLFGVPERPEDLPDYYEYFQTPSKDQLVALYNQSAVYLGTSRTEGWGLCIGEAMLCGCAVVCTDNAGYLEMAQNEKTALVSPVDDVEAMADNLMRFFADDALRQKIAGAGHRFISDFSIENAYAKFRAALGL